MKTRYNKKSPRIEAWIFRAQNRKNREIREDVVLYFRPEGPRYSVRKIAARHKVSKNWVHKIIKNFRHYFLAHKDDGWQSGWLREHRYSHA